MYRYFKSYGKDCGIAILTLSLVGSIMLYIYDLPRTADIILEWTNLIIFFTVIFILTNGIANAMKVLSIIVFIFANYLLWLYVSDFIGHYATLVALLLLLVIIVVLRVPEQIRKMISSRLEKMRQGPNGMMRPEDVPFGTLNFSVSDRSNNFRGFTILHIFGSLAMLLFLFFDRLVPVVGQYKPVGLILSFFLLIYGISVLFFGYIRGMVVPIFIASIYFVFIRTHDYLDQVFGYSASLSLLLQIILIILYTVAIFFIIRKYYWRFLVSYPYYYRDGEMIGAYMLLIDYIPIATYDILSTFSFATGIPDESLATPGDIRRLDALIRKTQEFCYHKQIVFAGYKLSFQQEMMTLYFYHNEKKSEPFKEQYYRLLERFADADIIYDRKKDEQYLFFQNNIFPDAYQMQEMYAEMVYAKCTEDGFDLEKPYFIQYMISIEDGKPLDDCSHDLIARGFDVIRTPEEDFYDEVTDTHYQVLMAAHMSNIGIDRLKYNTGTILGIIHKYNGNLENWNILEQNN